MTISRRSFLAALAGLGACAPGARRRATQSQATVQTTSSTTSDHRATSTTLSTARFVPSGPTTSAAVALTFHGSGDVGLLHALLDAAHAADAPITVFAVGSWLDANPDIAHTILAAGHEIANHTYTHPVLPRLDRQGIADEITRCRDALRTHAGEPGRWFRPSGTPTPTATMLDEAARAGYSTIVGYDIDPLDYQDPGADLVLRRVSAALHPGAIISLHTGHAGTVHAFEPMVNAVRARGLRPVRVHELLGA